MEKVFMKGCEAIAEAAIRGGCRFYAGYPITPQNQVPEYFARRMPQVGGLFMQGESEVASINMLYGAAAGGTRSMISSSSCGISLMSETIGWAISAQFPCVIANVQRGGPGIGDIAPSQQDYDQATKSIANGGGHMLVYAPASLQETVDKMYIAFDKAEEYRSPVLMLLDGVTGGMMESVILPEMRSDEYVAERKQKIRDEWGIAGKHDRKFRSIIGGGRAGEPLQNLNKALVKKYEAMRKETEYEEYQMDDAEVVITSYGVSARFAKAAVNQLRKQGYKVGMIRPVVVYPFPYEAYDKLDFGRIRGIVSTEMSIPELFANDVRAAVKERTTVDTYCTSGGVILDTNEIVKLAKEVYERMEA